MKRCGFLHAVALHARSASAMLLVVGMLSPWSGARADEGGVAYWWSGQYASLAAVPPTAGWTLTVSPYYYNGSADASKTFPRGNKLVTGLDTHAFLTIAQLSYAWDTKVFGGTPSIGLAWGLGSNSTAADALFNIPSATPQVTSSDSASGGSDLFPIGSLSWTEGSNNWMVYLTGGIPTGAYSAQRLSNIGLGHGAIDAGGGYTYLNEKSGFEVSGVTGFTGNWKNPDTSYKSGVDWHLDWAVSQFLSESWEIGAVGYVYQQLTNDSYPTDGVIGAARQRILGGFRSRVASVGPEVGYVFKLGNQQGYLNVRGYWEFAAQNRVEGYALFATINLPLGK